MQAVEISRIDYEPLDMDILYAEGITLSNSLSSMEFSFPVSGHEDSLDPVYQHDPSLRSPFIPSSLHIITIFSFRVMHFTFF